MKKDEICLTSKDAEDANSLEVARREREAILVVKFVLEYILWLHHQAKFRNPVLIRVQPHQLNFDPVDVVNALVHDDNTLRLELYSLSVRAAVITAGVNVFVEDIELRLQCMFQPLILV